MLTSKNISKPTRPLNKREQKKLMRKKDEAKNKRKSILFGIGFGVSLFLFWYSWIQYYWTIIDYMIPLIIFIVAGLALGGVLKRYFDNSLKERTIKAHLFWFMISTGSIVTALFFFLNNIFASSEESVIQASIVDTHITRIRSGKESVKVEVQLVNFTKDLSFPIEDKEHVYASNFVLLSVSKGGLGFEVIRDRTLIK